MKRRRMSMFSSRILLRFILIVAYCAAARGGYCFVPTHFGRKMSVVASTNNNIGKNREAASTICSTAGVGNDASRDSQISETTEPSTNMQFYTLEGGMCPYAARTLIALQELGIPFDTVDINAKQKPDWYLKINPKGKVPALQNPVDKSVVYESSICNEYLSDFARSLDDEDSDNDGNSNVWKLMPRDPSGRAKLRLLNDHYDSKVGPIQFTFLMNKDVEKDETMKVELESSLQLFEDTLQSHDDRGDGGSYLMGNEFTLADVHIFPFVQRLLVTLKHFKTYELPNDRFPKLLAWYDLCFQRDSIRRGASKLTNEIIDVYEKFLERNYSFGGWNKNR